MCQRESRRNPRTSSVGPWTQTESSARSYIEASVVPLLQPLQLPLRSSALPHRLHLLLQAPGAREELGVEGFKFRDAFSDDVVEVEHHTLARIIASGGG